MYFDARVRITYLEKLLIKLSVMRSHNKILYYTDDCRIFVDRMQEIEKRKAALSIAEKTESKIST